MTKRAEVQLCWLELGDFLGPAAYRRRLAAGSSASRRPPFPAEQHQRSLLAKAAMVNGIRPVA